MAQELDVGPLEEGYVFRGQTDVSWTLESSLRRSLPRDISTKDALEFERQALSEFQARAHLYLSSTVLPRRDDVGSWWGLMQHHNAPTRMLDWTASIYVALYFAVEQSFDRDGAVWYVPRRLPGGLLPEIDSRQMQEGFGARWFSDPSARPSVWFWERATKTDRMVAQQGIFLTSRQVLTAYSHAISDAMPEEQGYGKIVVPAGLKLKCLRQLRLANITAGSLFPAVDGLGRSIKEMTYFVS